jgi:hypothetical protein
MRRSAIFFLLHLAVAFVVALVVAGIWTLARGGPFEHGFVAGCYLIGTFVLLMGALGVGGLSPSSGLVNAAGRIPGVRAATLAPGTSTLSMTAVLLLAGLSLDGLALGLQLG